MDIQEYNEQIIQEYLDYKKEVPKNTYKGISADCKAIAKYLSDSNAIITSLTEVAPSKKLSAFLRKSILRQQLSADCVLCVR